MVTPEKIQIFHNEDMHRYKLFSKNWLLQTQDYAISKGYIPLGEIEDIEQLIDYLACWYERTYSNTRIKAYIEDKNQVNVQVLHF